MLAPFSGLTRLERSLRAWSQSGWLHAKWYEATVSLVFTLVSNAVSLVSGMSLGTRQNRANLLSSIKKMALELRKLAGRFCHFLEEN